MEKEFIRSFIREIKKIFMRLNQIDGEVSKDGQERMGEIPHLIKP